MDRNDRRLMAYIFYQLFLLQCKDTREDPETLQKEIGVPKVALLEDLRGGEVLIDLVNASTLVALGFLFRRLWNLVLGPVLVGISQTQVNRAIALTFLWTSILYASSDLVSSALIPSVYEYNPIGCNPSTLEVYHATESFRNPGKQQYEGFEGRIPPEIQQICPKPSYTDANLSKTLIRNAATLWVNASPTSQALLQQDYCKKNAAKNTQYCNRIAEQKSQVIASMLFESAKGLSNFVSQMTGNTTVAWNSTAITDTILEIDQTLSDNLPSKDTTAWLRNTLSLFVLAASASSCYVQYTTPKKHQQAIRAIIQWSNNVTIHAIVENINSTAFRNANPHFFMPQTGVTLGVNDKVDVDELKNLIEVLAGGKSKFLNQRKPNEVKAALYWDLHYYLTSLSTEGNENLFDLLEQKVFTLRLMRSADLEAALTKPRTSKNKLAQSLKFEQEPITHGNFVDY